MYEKGESAPEDDVKGYAWMVLTAAPGDENAVKAIARARQKMTARQVPEALKLAGDLRRR